MKHFYTALLLLLPILACTTTPEGEEVPDWPKINAAGDLIVNQLDAQIALRQADDPDTAEDLNKVRDIAVLVNDAVAAVESGEASFESVEAYLDAATAILKQMQANADPEDSQLIATLAGIQGGIDLLRVLIA